MILIYKFEFGGDAMSKKEFVDAYAKATGETKKGQKN